MSLYYYKDGSYEISLYTTSSGIQNYACIYKNDVKKYAILGAIDGSQATDLRIRKDGTTYAFLADSYRGVFAGGATGAGPALTNTIDYTTISVQSGASDFGDLSDNRYQLSATSNGFIDRGVFIAGDNVTNKVNVIEYITISTTGDATNFGNLGTAIDSLTATSNGANDRGVFGGGIWIAGFVDYIGYITISSTGDGTEFGYLTQKRQDLAATSNGTSERGIFAGGYDSVAGYVNIIDYITISSTGNATNFGDLIAARGGLAATSNGTNDRGVFGGGFTGAYANVIDYVTISSTGNAADFGDLTSAKSYLTATSDGTSERGIFAGGGAYLTIIESINISSLGNATSFSNLTIGRYSLVATSDA